MRGLHVDVEGLLVQILPADSDLDREAIQEAFETTYDSTPTRIVRAEHLITIKLKIGRPKDLVHIYALLQKVKIDCDYLQGIFEAPWLDRKVASLHQRGETKMKFRNTRE